MPDRELGGAGAVTADEVQTLAAELWRQLSPGSVVWLSGDLGAGKTTFVQALCRVAGAVTARSPTFALVHEYPSPHGLLVHVDCYRLRSSAEALDIDFPALATQARLLVIEWPERAGAHAPLPDAHLAFHHTPDPDRRRVERIS